MDRDLAALAVVQERDRITGSKLLDPAPAERERRRDENERRFHAAPRRFQRRQRPEGAPDDDRGRIGFGGRQDGRDDGLKVELLEGGSVQVRGDQAELVGR